MAARKRHDIRLSALRLSTGRLRSSGCWRQGSVSQVQEDYSLRPAASDDDVQILRNCNQVDACIYRRALWISGIDESATHRMLFQEIGQLLYGNFSHSSLFPQAGKPTQLILKDGLGIPPPGKRPLVGAGISTRTDRGFHC